MFGKKMHEGLGKWHFWFSVIFITLVFGGQLLVGYAGQQRRLWNPYHYSFLQHLQPMNRWTSYFAFALLFGQLFFILNFFWTVFRAQRPEEAKDTNPWAVGTLEWTHAASPPLHHNFDVIPTVLRGPHEYANPDVKKVLGKDWIGQAEEAPQGLVAPAIPGAV